MIARSLDRREPFQGPHFALRTLAKIGDAIEAIWTYGTSRRIIQHFCASVLQVPLSLGAMQKLIDRVAQAIAPHYGAIATQARQAFNYIDVTSWFLTSTLRWLWVMVSDTAAVLHNSSSLVPNLGRWPPDCLAHLIRTARGLAERQPPDRWPVASGR